MRPEVHGDPSARTRKAVTGNRSSNSREFDPRVYVGSAERLIQFTNHAWDDFELRSGDEIVICYVNGAVAVIYNATINTAYKITVRSNNAVYVLLAIIVIIVIAAIAHSMH